VTDASFDRWGPNAPTHPVILSVPHAGREYPAAMLPLLRLPPARLVALEDRHADAVARAALGGGATPGGCTALVQRLPRAWIDLNRGEDERDPAVDEGARAGTRASAGGSDGARAARLASGLGLVPRRAGAAGELWRRRLTDAEVGARLEDAHRPYHAALAELLAAARARFGAAVLLDLHSMPPLRNAGGGAPARLVIGDRFGRAAGARFTARAEAAAGAGGHPVALNVPYAGGHVLERHGDPANGVHALQLELDRSLYLDAGLDRPGPDLAATAALVRGVIDALADELRRGARSSALPPPLAEAAE